MQNNSGITKNPTPKCLTTHESYNPRTDSKICRWLGQLFVALLVRVPRSTSGSCLLVTINLRRDLGKSPEFLLSETYDILFTFGASQAFRSILRWELRSWSVPSCPHALRKITVPGRDFLVTTNKASTSRESTSETLPGMVISEFDFTMTLIVNWITKKTHETVCGKCFKLQCLPCA